jgi:hypothetical protein
LVDIKPMLVPSHAAAVAAGMTALAAAKPALVPISPSDRLENAVRRARASVAKSKPAAALAKGGAGGTRAAEASAI